MASRPPPTIDAVFLTRNIDKPRVAAAELLELATQVDVWLDTGGSSLDIYTARAANPRLVVVTIRPFGTSGPYAGRAASDPVLLAMSGILDRAQSGAAGPMLPPARLASETAGAMAAFLALLSVLRGAAAGEGDHVVLSAHENLIQCSDTMLVRESATRGDTGIAVPRTRYPAFRSSDGGFVRPVLTSPAQWRAVRAWFGEPEELQDPVLDTSLGRAAAAEIIDPHYERLFGALTAEAASEEAQRRGIPVAPIWSPSAVLASEGMRARGTFTEVDMDGVTGLRPSGFLYLEGSKVGPRRRTLAPIEPAGDVLVELRARDSRFKPRVRTAGATETGRPLEGLRVLLIGMLMAGPEAAKLLADHGAEVIRIEYSGHQDHARLLGGNTGMSTMFVSMGRNNRSFGVNAKTPEGRQLVLELATRADVLVENLGRDALDGIGLTREVLRTVNPGLTRVSSQLFGDDGPWGAWRGFGNQARGMGAMTWLWRDPTMETGFGDDSVYFPDQFIGRIAATAVLASLLTGGGRQILVSQTDAVLNVMPEVVLAESLRPGSVVPGGSHSLDHAPGGVFPCTGDGEWCVLTVADDEQWEALRRVIAEPWTEEARFASTGGRRAAAEELHGLVAAWTAGRSADRVSELLKAHGVPAAPVMPTVALLDDRHLIEHDFLRLHVQPGYGPLFVEGDSWRSAHLPASPLRPAPALGQDTVEIATEILGRSPAEVTKLLDARVLEQANPEPA